DETTVTDPSAAFLALDIITDEQLLSIVLPLLHSRQELRDVVIAELGGEVEPSIPLVSVEAIGSIPEVDMRRCLLLEFSGPATSPMPPTRKRPSLSRSARAARKARRREGSHDTLLRLMRGEEVLDSTYPAVFQVEEACPIGEPRTTIQLTSDASTSRLDSTPSDLKCFDPFENPSGPGLDGHNAPFDLFPNEL
ncbi:hypothetical protein Pmar_PMAR004248, partial [Perkinsus marinus ATCC 50983]